jgi:membrane protease subunit (stomatin/prohibitin family)
MPGTVEVTFSEEYFRDGYLEAWMPNGSSLISVSVRSAEWSSFRQKLINEALRLRETQTANIYRQYFAKDMLPIFGVPAAFIFGFATSRTMKHFFREIE